MQALSPTSQRRSYAAAVAAELRRAIRARGASTKRVCAATGLTRSNVAYYLAGRNLPTIAAARVLADVLDAPRNLALVIKARTIRCGRQGCKREFLYEGGKPKVYCSQDCAGLARKMAAGDDGYDPGGRRLAKVVQTELDDARRSRKPIRRGALEVALAIYANSDSKRHARFSTYERRIEGLHEAIDTMCRQCEPEGLCRTADCPLRAFSPLPLAGSFTEDRVAGELPEAWTPEQRARRGEITRAILAERWSKPEERERAAEQMRARHAAMSPADKDAWVGRIAEAKAKRGPEAQSAAARRAWETRRARAAS